jgi:hypothetical protein
VTDFWLILHKKRITYGQFVEQKLMLSSSFMCDQNDNFERHYFGHTLLFYLSQTRMFNKPTSGGYKHTSLQHKTVIYTKKSFKPARQAQDHSLLLKDI